MKTSGISRKRGFSNQKEKNQEKNDEEIAIKNYRRVFQEREASKIEGCSPWINWDVEYHNEQ
jgi:hypothetical protein